MAVTNNEQCTILITIYSPYYFNNYIHYHVNANVNIYVKANDASDNTAILLLLLQA